MYFLNFVLPQLYFPTTIFPTPPLFNPETLRECNVLELGSGTGLMAICLSRFVKRWVCSDQLDCLKLIVQNLGLNPSSTPTTVLEIDWMYPTPPPPPSEAYDLIFAFDCIYNPSLIPGFLHTLTSQTTEGRTIVCVVMEVRSEDVVSEFLNAWLEIEGWQVARFPWGDQDGSGGKFVGWIGWRKIHEDLP